MESETPPTCQVFRTVHILTARYDVARSNQGPSGAGQVASEPVSPVAAATTAVPVPDTAGITNAFAAASPAAPHAASVPNAVAAAAPKRLAEDRQIFHGLFQDANAAPVASLVSELWTAPALAAGVAGPPGEQSISAGLRDLFKDPAQGS